MARPSRRFRHSSIYRESNLQVAPTAATRNTNKRLPLHPPTSDLLILFIKPENTIITHTVVASVSFECVRFLPN